MDVRYERLVVPVVGSADDDRALAVAQQVVEKRPVALTLIYVVEVAQSMPLDAELPDEIARGEAALHRAEAGARRVLGKGSDIFTELLQARSVGAAIVDEAIERDADVIVMTAAVLRRHGRPTLGATVDYVLLNAPCEVLAIRRPAGDALAREPSWR